MSKDFNKAILRDSGVVRGESFYFGILILPVQPHFNFKELLRGHRGQRKAKNGMVKVRQQDYVSPLWLIFTSKFFCILYTLRGREG